MVIFISHVNAFESKNSLYAIGPNPWKNAQGARRTMVCFYAFYRKRRIELSEHRFTFIIILMVWFIVSRECFLDCPQEQVALITATSHAKRVTSNCFKWERNVVHALSVQLQ